MILDTTSGPKSMYRGLHRNFIEGEEIVFLDIRLGTYTITRPKGSPGRKDPFHKFVIEPTIQGDLKSLPLRDQSIKLILFDPPHTKGSSRFVFSTAYGSMSRGEYAELVRNADSEFKRVLEPRGLLLAKLLEYEKRHLIAYQAFKSFKLLLDLSTPGKGSNPGKYSVHWYIFLKSENGRTQTTLS